MNFADFIFAVFASQVALWDFHKQQKVSDKFEAATSLFIKKTVDPNWKIGCDAKRNKLTIALLGRSKTEININLQNVYCICMFYGVPSLLALFYMVL